MLKYFIDDNGDKISIESAMSGYFLGRFPLAYIRLCAEERAWTGVPSVTQLLDGTRMQYLMILTDYGIRLDDQAFQVVGTIGHSILEKSALAENLTETQLLSDEKTGILDSIERYPNGENILIDYKTWGSFRVCLAMGMEKTRVPVLDSDGVQVKYKSSGKWHDEGEQRYKWEYKPKPENADLYYEELQLNAYRYMAEDEFKIKISKMMLFIIVRDGGLAEARKRGIDSRTISIPIRELEYDRVNYYFKNKRNALIAAIGNYQNTLFQAKKEFCYDSLAAWCPPICDSRETWEGRRCKGFCPVAEICRRIG